MRIRTYILIFTLAFLNPAAFADSPSASSTSGENAKPKGVAIVAILRGTARIGTRPLRIGDSILANDVILTEKDARVKLLLADRTIVDIGPSSRFTIKEYEASADPEDRQVESTLDAGRVRASVNRKLSKKGKFRIRTRSSVLAVRGTEFVLADDGGAEVLVGEGVVWVAPASSPDKVTAVESNRTWSLDGEASIQPKVVSLSSRETMNRVEQNRLANDTFTVATEIREDSPAGEGFATYNIIPLPPHIPIGALDKLSIPLAHLLPGLPQAGALHEPTGQARGAATVNKIKVKIKK